MECPVDIIIIHTHTHTQRERERERERGKWERVKCVLHVDKWVVLFRPGAGPFLCCLACFPRAASVRCESVNGELRKSSCGTSWFVGCRLVGLLVC